MENNNLKNKDRKIVAWEGTTVAARIAYKLSEFAALFPISPSTNIAEQAEEMAVKGETNVFGNKLKIVQMQSEAGAIGTIHGAAETGVLSTTFTASQGLLLMIPTLYKLRGNLLPTVLYVATRAIASRSLSIFSDHQDIYACRQTGVAILSCESVQEINDLGPVAHAVSLEASWPVIFAIDGYRTTHEVQKLELFTDEELKSFMDKEALEKYRARTLTPTDPVTRGGSEDEFTYFQSLEAQNGAMRNVLQVAKKYFKKASEMTNRIYAPFVYCGDENATDVIIIMGSAAQTVEETVQYLNQTENQKTGVVKVYLYRPFSIEDLVAVLPKSVQRIAVLDKTKEFGSAGEPLFADVATALKDTDILIIGGRYGLSSKNTTPAHFKAVFRNLKSEKPKNHFTIGIEDDVTHTSLPILDNAKTLSKNTSYLIWGLASDGMISASKNIIKIIADTSNNYTQGFFTYDSRKAGGATRSYLRFGNEEIRSPYYPDSSSFILCSKDNYILSFKHLIDSLQEGGTFFLNTTFTKEELLNFLPNRFKKQLADKKAKFYFMDAYSIARKYGLGNNINTCLQSAFFLLNPQLIQKEKAIDAMIYATKKTYGKKGDAIVQANINAITSVNEETVHQIIVEESWKDLKVNEIKRDLSNYLTFATSLNNMEGNEFPVSTFTQKFDGKSILDGTMLNHDITFNMQRQLAAMVPKWIPENCIQCNQCAFYCPHATIRAFQLTDEDIKKAPRDFVALNETQMPNQPPSNYKFTIHVDPENCVGCGLCVEVCPGKDPRDRSKKALKMVPAAQEAYKYRDLTEYLYKGLSSYTPKGFTPGTLKWAGFLYPYFEVSGACAGCGETPYYRLLTQLFGKDMVIANATGCTSIFSGTYPFTPFTTDKDKQGPAWSNSLYENNAEFGYGMRAANDFKVERVRLLMAQEMNNVEPELQRLFDVWLNTNKREEQRVIRNDLIAFLERSKNEKVKDILNFKDVLVNKSMWMVGGDGWSTDIDFGGLAHIMASGKNVNVLVLDTEVYSNTGGQTSSSTPLGAAAKFNAAGKKTAKKDLGKIFMTFNNVYVARISLGMNPAQAIKAMQEAEAYDGPSIVIAYAPCIEHGIKGGLNQHRIQEMNAVLSGYWPIYRFDPRRALNNLNPLQIDFLKPNFTKIKDYLLAERRFAQIFAKSPEDTQKILDEIVREHEYEFNVLLAQANSFNNSTHSSPISSPLKS